MAITLATIANRLNMKLPRTVRLTIEAQSGRFQAIRLPMVDRTSGGETAIMQSGQDAAEFDLDEAKRVLGDVFAPASWSISAEVFLYAAYIVLARPIERVLKTDKSTLNQNRSSPGSAGEAAKV